MPYYSCYIRHFYFKVQRFADDVSLYVFIEQDASKILNEVLEEIAYLLKLKDKKKCSYSQSPLYRKIYMRMYYLHDFQYIIDRHSLILIIYNDIHLKCGLRHNKNFEFLKLLKQAGTIFFQ